MPWLAWLNGTCNIRPLLSWDFKINNQSPIVKRNHVTHSTTTNMDLRVQLTQITSMSHIFITTLPTLFHTYTHYDQYHHHHYSSGQHHQLYQYHHHHDLLLHLCNHHLHLITQDFRILHSKLLLKITLNIPMVPLQATVERRDQKNSPVRPNPPTGRLYSLKSNHPNLQTQRSSSFILHPRHS